MLDCWPTGNPTQGIEWMPGPRSSLAHERRKWGNRCRLHRYAPSWACSSSGCGPFELARRADGIIVAGVKVGGDIVPGDAKKLLDFYKTYGVMTSPVHLRSKGGNVEEAMKMGAIIRRLRLETEVPVWNTGRQPIDPIKVDRQENMICASACFLVYAGGASRFGNYLAMHRPFFRKRCFHTLRFRLDG